MKSSRRQGGTAHEKFGTTPHLRTRANENLSTYLYWARDTSQNFKDKKLHMVGWVGGWFFQDILPLRGSILQAGTCQILSSAENPRWSLSVAIQDRTTLAILYNIG